MDRLDARLREIPPSAVHPLVLRVAAVDRFRGWWQGREPLHPSVVGRLRRRAAEDAASAAVGAAPRPSPAGLPSLRASLPHPTAARAALERGTADLLRAVFEGHREMVLDEALVLRFHARLFRHGHPPEGRPGAFRGGPLPAAPAGRRDAETLALRPSDPLHVPHEIRAAAAWAAARITGGPFHPLLVTAAFLLEFLAVRPFAAGNELVASALAHLLLLRAGYDHVAYAPLDRAVAARGPDWAVALRRAQATRHLQRPDLSPWLLAFLDALGEQARELEEAVAGRPPETLLSANQLAVLSLCERHGEVTNRLVRREAGLPRETAKQVLSRLVALNLLSRAGAGRAARYRRAPLQGGGAR